jgi:tRNA (guanine10-N2)-dimethyltransferase
VSQCLEEVYRVLIPGRKMVFVDDRPIEHLIEDSGFNVLELHKERVHRSLTRHIFVCKK